MPCFLEARRTWGRIRVALWSRSLSQRPRQQTRRKRDILCARSPRGAHDSNWSGGCRVLNNSAFPQVRVGAIIGLMSKPFETEAPPLGAVKTLTAPGEVTQTLKPVPSPGRINSSTNSVTHGLAAHRVLMPGETIEDHLGLFRSWSSTLQPTTEGEAILVGRIADVSMRLDRLDRMAQAILDAGVESELAKTSAAKKVTTFTEAYEAVGALATTSESVASTVAYEVVKQLAPAMRRTLEMADDADVPAALLLPLRDALNCVVVDTFLDAEPTAFQELAAAARDVETYLAVGVATSRGALEAERDRLASDPTLGDPEALKRLERHRGRILKELGVLLGLYKQAKELVPPKGAAGGSLVTVELKVLGRPYLAQR